GAALAGVLLLGMGRYWWATAPPGPGELAALHGQGRVQVTALVTAEPAKVKQGWRYELDVLRLHVGGDRTVQLSGGAVVTVLQRQFEMGDLVTARGEPVTPRSSEDFDFRGYLAARGVATEIRRVWLGPGDQLGSRWYEAAEIAWLRGLRWIREQLRGVVNRSPLLADERALILGLVVGDKSQLTAEVKQTFQDTGTVHLLVVSGSNVALQLLIVMVGTRRFSQRRFGWRFGIGAGWIAGYTVIVGADPPVVRAAIMAVAGLIADERGSRIGGWNRASEGLGLLSLAATLMTLFNPALLWDLSFQLSFLATAGVVIVAPWLHEDVILGWGRRVVDQASALNVRAGLTMAAGARWMRRWGVTELIAVTVGAQLAAEPLAAYAFGTAPTISVLANLIAAPIAAATTTAGVLGLGGGFLLQMFPIAPYLLIPAGLGTFLLNSILQWLATLQGTAFVVGTFSGALLATYYAGLFSLAVGLTAPALTFRQRALPAFAPLVVIGMFLGTELWARPAGTAASSELVLFGAREGGATLVRAETGQVALVLGDGGGPRVNSLRRELPLWQPGFDAVVVVSPQTRNLEALVEIGKRYRIDQVIVAGVNELPDRWREQVGAIRGTVRVAAAKEVVAVGPTSRLELEGRVVRVVTPRGSALLAGEVSAQELRRLTAGSEASDVVVLPRRSFERALLTGIGPRIAVYQPDSPLDRGLTSREVEWIDEEGIELREVGSAPLHLDWSTPR
ncbi:MAG: ComEC/Rec2 family competence protein, partial [Chloroflexi bacterium]|nr:ComEC/Rec2 family competence protein [Chloroflexota bacterium]